MTTKAADLTRADALTLARAKWGAKGGTYDYSLLDVRGAWDDYPYAVVEPGTGTAPTYWAGRTWREACERAGLLPSAPAALKATKENKG